MHHENIGLWQHDHSFGQDQKRKGESRTIIVMVITATMMIVEILAGLAFGSMALLADGMHMASHAVALGISAFAYVYARRRAHDEQFSFGTGKVNALGGFAGATLLAVFALIMAWESVERLISPVDIAFDQALWVAVLGLLVNGASVFILGIRHDHQNDDRHGHTHHHDLNLRSAYFHVLADALTSLTAIAALLAAKYLAWVWMDPLMGIVGSVLVARWSLLLLKQTSGVLLDRQATKKRTESIRRKIEADGDARVADLHVWSIGPGAYSLTAVVVADHPKMPEDYKRQITGDPSLVHVTMEIHKCRPGETTRRAG